MGMLAKIKKEWRQLIKGVYENKSEFSDSSVIHWYTLMGDMTNVNVNFVLILYLPLII